MSIALPLALESTDFDIMDNGFCVKDMSAPFSVVVACEGNCSKRSLTMLQRALYISTTLSRFCLENEETLSKVKRKLHTNLQTMTIILVL